jgi:hypothetical protein
MNIEEEILEQIRELSREKQQIVLNFSKFLNENKTLPSPNPTLTAEERAEKWLTWVKSHSSDYPPLPEEALHRDTMYE